MSDLREEIRQSTPFATVAEEAFLNLRRTAHLFEQVHAHFFRPWELTPIQYNVLRILRGSHPGSLPCHEIGSRMVTAVPDVTRLVNRLERKELVRRESDPSDRRVVRVGITDRGLELLAEIDAPLQRWIERAMVGLDEADLERLVELLERARDGLAAVEPVGGARSPAG